MAAVKLIPKQKIVSAAVEVIRKNGVSALNARTLAKQLNCSTRPIYLSFSGMEEVRHAAIKEIYNLFNGFVKREIESGKYPVYKSYGMAYIRFACEEKELFKAVYMTEQSKEEKDEEGYAAVISAVKNGTGLDRERAELFHFESWIFVHGIAAMAATGYAEFDEDLTQKLLTDMFEGLKARFGIK
ncbi:MAG: WHG domain-containing protein [Clostridia bacterium]|nr:WHG domain-containing protein [Clostridia bacterium]